MPLCRKCATSFPTKLRINGRMRNLQNRTFCLSCSPFGQHNTRTNIIVEEEGTRWCPRCERMLETKDFYRRRDSYVPSSYCRECNRQLVAERQQQFKKRGVEYKGGTCARCGYSRYIGSLEFHHLDPEAKEFNLADFHSTDFEKLKAELDKCLLLCANCHREEHARQNGAL
jgi:hypothetical protein